MSASVGKAIRLARILSGKGGRSACLAFDHGMMIGPVDGNRDLRAVVATAAEARMDGIILTPGGLEMTADLLAGRDKPSVILRVDQTTMWRIGGRFGYPAGHTRQISTVEEALRMGADAVLTYFFTCHEDPALESRSIEIAAGITQEARRLGVPHIAEPMAARGGFLPTPFDPEVIAMNNRMAAELGADVLKTDWSGSVESFAEVVRSAGRPVLAAGGAREDDDAATLRLAADVLSAGAYGVLFGRTLFQSPDPLRLMKAVRGLVHDELTLDKALQSIAPAKGKSRR